MPITQTEKFQMCEFGSLEPRDLGLWAVIAELRLESPSGQSGWESGNSCVNTGLWQGCEGPQSMLQVLRESVLERDVGY